MIALNSRAYECEPDARTVQRSRLITVVVAMVAALAVWVVAGPLAGAGLDINSGASSQHVGPAAVLIVSAFAGLAAWALAAVLERTSSRPRLIWTVVAVILLALSMTGPMTLGIGGDTKGALLVMHSLVGGTLIAGFRQTIRR